MDTNAPGRPGNNPQQGFSAVILGDTGEGDASQYALLPLIRALDPDFMIINGDVAYPAGNMDDFLAGFFEPYRDLRIPVWAVPGNHEYYSDGKGKEFFEVFASTIRSARWAEFGLVMKPQPGSYWELAERGIPLVILGVDTGQAGSLDGSKGVLGLFKRDEDAKQHTWLEWRLREAEARGDTVILLFHIPKLVDGAGNNVRLQHLHSLIASYRCIKLVIGAHIHNMQWYSPATFARYLQALTGHPPLVDADYVVSGSGGATVGSTHFKGPYPTAAVYPTPKEFDDFASAGEKLVGKLPGRKTMAGDFISATGNLLGGLVGRDISGDADQMRLQSLLHIRYAPGTGTVVTPHYIQDLTALYKTLPQNSIIQVQQGVPALPATDCQACQRPPQLNL